jgi:HlyD family secretion protein
VRKLSRLIAGVAVIAGLAWMATRVGIIDELHSSFASASAIDESADGNGAYSVVSIEPRHMIDSVTATGSIVPIALISVSSPISGKIKEIAADFNTEVKRGDPIAIIDSVYYQLAVHQTEADLDIARANVATQNATIDRISSDLEVARFDLATASANVDFAKTRADDAAGEDKRKQALGTSGSAAERERAHFAALGAQAQLRAAEATEQAKSWAVKSSEAQLRSANSQLLNYQSVVRQKVAALERAQIDLDATVIRAGVDGMVINRDVEVDQAVSPETSVLFTIAQDLRAMQVNAAVTEAEIGRIKVGQRMEFTVDAYPGQSFAGQVIQVRKQPQITQNVVTYTVVASAANQDLLLMPGMTATASIIVDETGPILAVPNAALRFRPPGVARAAESRVFVIRNNKPIAVAVKPGFSDSAYTAVESEELRNGDQVIIGLATQEIQSSTRPWLLGFF